jgi:Na+/H+ antiporter NhaD/arsenite permease-like protein
MAALLASREAMASAVFLAALPGPLVVSAPAAAAEPADVPWPLALPFAGMLLSIALGPVVVKEWWHIHYEKAAAFWTGLTLIGLCAAVGPFAAAADFVHCVALEYLPFILMLFGLLCLSGVEHRGVLTPLGDPPLFLGYLHGVDFFWTARSLWPHVLFAAGVLLTVFYRLVFLRARRKISSWSNSRHEPENHRSGQYRADRRRHLCRCREADSGVWAFPLKYLEQE